MLKSQLVPMKDRKIELPDLVKWRSIWKTPEGQRISWLPRSVGPGLRAWELFGTKEEGAEKPWLSDDSLTYV